MKALVLHSRYLVGVSKPDVDISLNIFGAIGGQKRVVGVNFGSTNAKRDSGVGREYGRYGIEAFVETRAILESHGGHS
jgi:hypothetical protein